MENLPRYIALMHVRQGIKIILAHLDFADWTESEEDLKRVQVDLQKINQDTLLLLDILIKDNFRPDFVDKIRGYAEHLDVWHTRLTDYLNSKISVEAQTQYEEKRHVA